MTDDKPSFAKRFLAGLGVIGTAIGIFVFVTGKRSLPESMGECPAFSVCKAWDDKRGAEIAIRLLADHSWKFADGSGNNEYAILGDFYFSEATGEYHVIATETKPADSFSCHSCYPYLSLHTFKLVVDEWKHWGTSFEAYQGGGWGQSNFGLALKQIGSSRNGLIVHDGFMGQGCRLEWVAVFAMIGAGPQELVTIPTEQNCAAFVFYDRNSNDDYSTDCEVIESAGAAFYDIRVERHFPSNPGTDADGKPLHASEVLRFDGKRYTTVEGSLPQSARRRPSTVGIPPVHKNTCL